MKECEEKANEVWKDGKPKRLIYGLPIIIFWILVIGFIVYKFFIKCYVYNLET